MKRTGWFSYLPRFRVRAFTMLLSWGLPWLLTPQSARAFPEMARHGYVNCTSCHVSPSGGGALTSYGRELSKELLSAWSKENAKGDEGAFAYGMVRQPQWLTLWGAYRSLYLYQDTAQFRDGRYQFMQADLEGAGTWKQFTLDATLGYQNPRGAKGVGDHLVSRRHFLLAQLTDEASVRAGRFAYAFGVNSPDHVRVTRRVLGIGDEGTETYNAELAYLSGDYSLYATGILGRPDEPALKRETGVALSMARNITERAKVGVSYLRGASQGQTRHVLGPFGIVGITPALYLLSEADFQSTSTTWGLAEDQRLGYEVFRGVHLIGLQELARLDFRDESSIVQSWGGGVDFFPRPHLELSLTWKLQQLRRLSADWNDFAYLMFQMYL